MSSHSEVRQAAGSLVGSTVWSNSTLYPAVYSTQGSPVAAVRWGWGGCDGDGWEGGGVGGSKSQDAD